MSDSDETPVLSSSSADVETSSESESESVVDRPTRSQFRGHDDDEEQSSCSLPKKRRYRRSIHHGLSDKLARYYNVPFKNPLTSTTTILVDRKQASTGESDSFVSASSSSLSETTDTDTSTSDSDISLDTGSDHELNPELEESGPDPKEEYRNTPLFEGSQHNIYSAYSLVMLYVNKHSLSRQAFSDLLMLIKSLLPKSTFTSSVYKMKEVLKRCISFKEPIIHSYCDHCQTPLERGSLCQNEVCFRNKSKTVKFMDLRLEKQLEEFFLDERFCKMVSRQELFLDNEEISDITDGSKYKELVQSERRQRSDVHLTFTMNTDGVAVFSSSKKGNLWPVYLAINELPTRLRFSRKYLLPCLLHCEVEKPNMCTYLAPLMQTLKKLYSDGIEVMTPHGKTKVTGQLLTSSLDLPARALVSNMKQFNGKSACIMCFDEGECAPGQSLHRYYPFKDSSVPRTHQSMLHDAREASRTGNAVNGIKGASPLIVLRYIDLPEFFVIDWMHCVLLGVVKKLLSFWLDGTNRNKDFYIGHNMALLNNRLLKIKIPNFISRRQRSLADHAHWKASECREWLIHFSMPVLDGQLKSDAFVHYALLVTAMALLTKDHISVREIDYADQLLLDFCKLFSAIYVDQNQGLTILSGDAEEHNNLQTVKSITKQTMNVHLLKHLAQFTRLYGPLFSHSAFGFESMNSHIKNMVHGTGHVNSQISFAVGIAKSLGQLVRELTEETSEAIRKTALCLGAKYLVEDSATTTFMALGRQKELKGTDEAFCLCPENRRSVAYTFPRLQTPEGVYFSRQHQQRKTKNSYTVAFMDHGENKFGCISSFVEIDSQQYAVVIPFQTSKYTLSATVLGSLESDLLKHYGHKTLCHHIYKIEGEEGKKLIPVRELRKKCVLLDVTHQLSFVSCPPNLVEHG